MKFNLIIKPFSIALLIVGVSQSALAMEVSTNIFTAALDGDTKAVGQCLDLGVPIDYNKNAYGATPLAFAADQGHLETVQFLLKKGAFVNSIDYNHITPLLRAVYANQLNITRLLLQWGADPNKLENSMGQAALHVSCSTGNLEMTKLLLEYDADINLKDKYWCFPAVVKANMNGHTAIVKLLSDEERKQEYQPLLTKRLLAKDSYTIETLLALNRK